MGTVLNRPTQSRPNILKLLRAATWVVENVDGTVIPLLHDQAGSTSWPERASSMFARSCKFSDRQPQILDRKLRVLKVLILTLNFVVFSFKFDIFGQKFGLV